MLYRPGLLGRLPCPQDWYVPSAPPTINVDFGAGVLPSGWTFTRASTGTDSTYQDNPNQQTYNTLAANAPLINQWGIKCEPQATNYYLNSDAPATQSITCTLGQVVVVWFVGSGSLNCTAGTGTFNNLGFVVPNSWRTITCTAAGTFQIVASGTVYRVQAETNGSNFPTSYIPTTAAAVTRQETRLNANFFGGQLNRLNGTYWIELMRFSVGSGEYQKLLTSGTGSYVSNAETDQIQAVPGGAEATFQVYTPAANSAGAVSSSSAFTPQIISRIAASYDPQRIAICANYGTVTAGSISGRPSSLIAVTLGGGPGTSPVVVPNCYFRGFRYWPTTMSDQELHECTGASYYAGKPVLDLDGTVANQWRMWTASRTAANGVLTDAVMDDAAGTTWSQYGTGAIPPGSLRFTPKGMLLESARNNYLPNSDALAASGVTGNLAATQVYMLTVRGSGSVTLTANTVVSPGLPATATQGVPAYIGPIGTTGTANFTRTGTVELAQLEQVGANNPAIGQDQGPTTLIKTTSAAQSRTAEGISIGIGPWFNQDQGTYLIEFIMNSRITGTYIWSVDDTTGNNREQVFAAFGSGGMLTWGSNTIYRGWNPGRIDPDVSQQPMPIKTTLRLVVSVSSDRKRQLAMNGVLGQTGNLRQFGDDGLTPRLIPTKMGIGMNQSGNISPSMFVKRWRYYDYAIFDEALRLLSIPDGLDLSFMTGTLDARITVTRAGTATFVDFTGTILTAGANTPRLDYDPVTKAALGTLVEEARTNLFLQSGDFNNASWAKSNCTLSAAVAAPDGTTSARGIIGNNTTFAYCAQNVTLTAGTTYTATTFFKAGTETVARLLFPGTAWNDAANRYATFTLTGAGSSVNTGNGVVATIQQFPNGWYRCCVTVTPDKSGAAGIHPARNANIGDNTSVQFYAWGAQIEAGAFPTSYIPTTTASVTRNADVLTMPSNVAWRNPTSETWLGEVMVAPSQNASARVIGSSTSSHGMVVVQNTTNGLAFDGAGLVQTANALTPMAVTKIASTWTNTLAKVCMNGGAIATTTSMTAGFSAVTTIKFGGDSNPSEQLNGWLRRVRYWGTALADTVLQQMTT